MKNNRLLGLFIFSILLSELFLSSCNDSESLGSGLLTGEWVNSKGIDTFKLSSKPYSIKDSLVLFGNFYTPSTVMVGQMNDPIFGKVKSGFSTQLRFVPDRNLAIKNKIIDSVVLSIRYDSSNFYGPRDQAMSLEVLPVNTILNLKEIYYPGTNIQLGMIPIGQLTNFVPNTRDSLSILINKQNIRIYPQLRIPIDTAVFMPMIRNLPDTSLLSVEYFQRDFPGIALNSTSGNSIIALNPGHSDSQLAIYYKDTDTTQGVFTFNLSDANVRVPKFDLDPSGSVAGSIMSGAITGDSLIMIQSMSGSDAEINIPFDSTIIGKYINYAVLELYALELPGDNLNLYKPCQLLKAADISNGNPRDITDVTTAINLSAGLSDLGTYIQLFGGNPVQVNVNGRQINKYSLNITGHFINSFRNRKDIRLRISPLFKIESAERVIFGGTSHSTYKAKLKLTFSE